MSFWRNTWSTPRIEDRGEFLEVVTESRTSALLDVLTGVTFFLIVASLVWEFLQSEYWVVYVVLFLALLEGLAAVSSSSARNRDWLRASDSCFQFLCTDGEGHRTQEAIRIEHIRWLEHDGDGQCLCAVTAYGTTPLLHVASEEDCWRIVERIQQKFPHLRERWKGQSAFDRHIIRLDLDRKDGL